jgi:glycosyltransferase involved in cell wall biosynthesis
MVRVRTFYQTDPAGTIPGGTDTFIRGIIKVAPHDIEISVVGLTTDPAARPVGRWSECVVDGRRVWFFPVGHLKDPRGRSRVPLSLQLTAGIVRHFYACASGCDVLEFHRVEPSLAFLRQERPKNAFIHTNMVDATRNSHSDIRWKAMPWLFFLIERIALRSMDTVFGVHLDAIEAYRSKYPGLASRFRFIPTWMDPDVFFPASPVERTRLRESLGAALGIGARDRVLISVGRLDVGKRPLLLLEGFALLARTHPEVRLVLVGDGALRPQIEAWIVQHRLAGRVVLAGLRPAREVADLLRLSDCFVLTSAYEGMPMCVLEALGCGIPVVTTRVGEVERVVRPGINGEILAAAAPEILAQALEGCLAHAASYRGEACLAAVSEFVPKTVLQPVYEQYRRLARRPAARRLITLPSSCLKRATRCMASSAAPPASTPSASTASTKIRTSITRALSCITAT